MKLDIVRMATVVSSGAVDSLDPFSNDLFTSFGGSERYFAFNVASEFFQRRRLVGINQGFDAATKKKAQRRQIT